MIGSQTPSFLNPIDYTDAIMVKTFYFIIHKILPSFKLMIMNVNKPILHEKIISLQNQYIRCLIRNIKSIRSNNSKHFI